MSRYDGRQILRTSNDLYEQKLKDRKLDHFRYFSTPKFTEIDEEDLEDELEDINEVDNIHAFKKKHMYTDDYDGRPSDTEK